MRAAYVDRYGPLDNLTVGELPDPEPGPGEVRVRMVAAACNPADFKVITGEVKMLHGRGFPMVVGYDFSGEVESLGKGVSDLSVGDAVYGHLNYNGSTKMGTFAELVVAPADFMARKPEGISHETAAAAATSGLTALQSLRDKGRIEAGKSALIIGASGGVGSIGVGIAKRLGAQVTAVCSTPTVELVQELGADRVIDRKAQDPFAQGGYDMIFDTPAAYSYGRLNGLLESGGAYVTTLPSLSLMTGLAASLFSSKRCSFVIVKPNRSDLTELGGMLTDGLQVPIDSTFPVRDLQAALERLQSGGMKGRVVVSVADGF